MPSPRGQAVWEICLLHPSAIQSSVFKPIGGFHGHYPRRLSLRAQGIARQGLSLHLHRRHRRGSGRSLPKFLPYKKDTLRHHHPGQHYRHPLLAIQRQPLYGQHWTIHQFRMQGHTDITHLLLHYLDCRGVQARQASNHYLHVWGLGLSPQRASHLLAR